MISTVKSGFRPNTRFWLKISPLNHHFSSIPSPEDQNLISLLNKCQKRSHLSQIHCSLIKSGLAHEPFKLSKLLASSALIDIQYASSIFNEIKKPNLFMFSTMLRGHSVGDYPKEALFLFNHTRAQNVLLDQFCFISVIKSCIRLRDFGYVGYGKGVHSIVVRSGFDQIVNVKNGLIQFYFMGGYTEMARQVFDEFPENRDLVSWATLMGGYLHVYQPIIVLDLFMELYRYGSRINITIALSVISAASDLNDVLLGELLHGYCIKAGIYLHTKAMTAFICMYGNFGNFGSAKRVFDEAPEKDIVAWNSMICKYAKNGEIETAVTLLELMNSANLKPNSSTLTGLISACVSNETLNIGPRISRYIEEEKLVIDTVLGTALIDLYSKSGLLQKAIEVFNQIENKDVKTWTAVISSCGINGQAKDAIYFLQKMKNENMVPNSVTFLVALNACSHGGLVNEGIECFESMVRDYNLTPKIEHYGCIIDLLGRAGLLNEAYRLVKSLPIERDEVAWRTLLATCRIYGNIELAEIVKNILNEMFGEHPADKMILSSTYAIAGRVPTDLGSGFVESRVKETGLSMIEVERER